MIVWAFAWRVEPAAMGPPFRFAKDFISRVDILISPQMDQLSLILAEKISNLWGTAPDLAFTVLFGCFILLSGTLQWFLLGRFIRWSASKYGQTTAIFLSAVIGCWIALAFVSWAANW